MFYKSKIINKNKIVEVLGEDLSNNLLEIKCHIKLEWTRFGYFDRCFLANQVLAKYNFFLKFFERRDMFRIFIRKKVQEKNEVTRNRSSSVIEKFNGYEMIRQDLANNERVDIEPINIVYEPVFDENISVPCFFTDRIYLAYRSYIVWFDRGKECICNRTVKQCHYCENFFAKTNDAMKKHFSICAAREEITYAFDNGQKINFQDNFKYLSDFPFTIYFNFKTTTTGGSPFF